MTSLLHENDSASGISSNRASVNRTSAVLSSGTASLGDFLFWLQIFRKEAPTLLCRSSPAKGEDHEKMDIPASTHNSPTSRILLYY